MADPRKFTTLLADDVSALRKLLKLAIEASGRFQVVAEASTGIEAIARAREAQPDVVLLDLSMPEMDGLEALPKVLESAPRTHVVVLSGFNHVRMAPVAKRLGASAYLEKGLEPDRLVQEVLAVLEGGERGRTPDPFASSIPERAAAAPPATLPPGPAFTATGAPRYTALVIGRDAATAQRLAALLAQQPFDARAATSLEQAQHMLSHSRLDAVVVDPVGLAAAPEDALIDLLSQAPSVPVVAVLDGGHSDLASRAIRLGVEDCVYGNSLAPDVLGRSLLYAIERRRAQEARRIARDRDSELSRLRDLEVMKNQFFNAAAHELGTPLTPIRLQLAVLKTLRNGMATPEERKSMDIIERNVQRLSHLDQDLLDVARLQAGHLVLDVKAVALADLLRETQETFEPMAHEAGIALSATCPPGMLIEADPKRLLQVLFNLVSNALKFTPRGGKVDVAARLVDGSAEIRVADTGLGLGRDQIVQLFQPFRQVLGAQQPAGLGTGLGLFVSRGIVETHGGRIWCESDGPGKGACFTFVIPEPAKVRLAAMRAP